MIQKKAKITVLENETSNGNIIMGGFYTPTNQVGNSEDNDGISHPGSLQYYKEAFKNDGFNILSEYNFTYATPPAKDKRVFLVENYSRYSERLPANLLEVEHRIRDIMFCDKTLHNKKLAKAITYYLRFIDELYHVIENRLDLENAQDKEQFEKIKAKYKKISERGAQVKGLYYISRDEPFPDLYENADFSIDTIKASIREGELKTKQILNGYYRNQRNVL